ncbi:Juxtaposed with another zinc finger protein 1 [Eumeta japonica]|uniref:Juxtaposed with another zinc finger protein 1 n=1 Tax=Eumeta variegata TaxID=151549 RepID=A0A4C1WAP5_EUMVA|nr:Juxtaposed with another zinc finger protein 1 [Eumeta japonica]
MATNFRSVQPTIDYFTRMTDTVNYDPIVVEQKEASQPSCIPLSYVLRFVSETSRRDIQSIAPTPDVRRRVMSAPKAPSVRSSTPTGSEFDEEELASQSEDSNDSWTTVEEYSSDFILRFGSRLNPSATSGALGTNAAEKPFACPVPGCKKRYKNVNGIKYHSKNGHKKDGKVKKGFKCHCGKSYKTAQGLKNHSSSNHAITAAAAADVTKSLIPPLKTIQGLVVTSSQQLQRRPFNIIEGLDGNKLVRIYDTKSLKDNITSFTPKHSLSHLNVISKELTNQNATSHVISTNQVSLTPSSTASEKLKYDRNPKITVHSQLPRNQSTNVNNQNNYISKVTLN